METLKIAGYKDVNFRYIIKDVSEIYASHLPLQGFSKNPKYRYENERRYHAEQVSQNICLEMAMQLDPAYVMDGIFPANGAPIVDMHLQVIGGNCRFMAIQIASERVSLRYAPYKKAIFEFAMRNNIDVPSCEKPILLRQIFTTIHENASLISCLNDSLTMAKNTRCDALSRGLRLSERSLNILSEILEENETLRSALDTSDSLHFIQSIIEDGVILATEGNKYLQGGYLNPDGKTLIEQSLRSRVFKSYETISNIPAPILGKVDACIPAIILTTKNKDWDICGNLESALNLLQERMNFKEKSNETFLNRINLITGKTPLERHGILATKLFLIFYEMNKKDCVKTFRAYAALQNKATSPMAKILNMDMTPAQAQDKAFAYDIPFLKPIKRIKAHYDNTSNISDVKSDQDTIKPIEIKVDRKVKNDCNKENSTLIASATCQDVTDALPVFFEKLDTEFEIIANSKTQYRLSDNGKECVGYRIIRSGRQWQLRILKDAVKPDASQDIGKNTSDVKADQDTSFANVDACKKEISESAQIKSVFMDISENWDCQNTRQIFSDVLYKIFLQVARGMLVASMLKHIFYRILKNTALKISIWLYARPPPQGIF